MKRSKTPRFIFCVLSLCSSLLFGQRVVTLTSDDRQKEMIFVEGGEFQMGNPAGLVQQKALPAHRVRLRGFFLDRCEVTVAQFSEYCKATAQKMPQQPPFSETNHPVVNVTWREASAYAQWRGKRLPTEAEWEYAARGGNRSRGYKFSGSDSLAEVGWYLKNSKEQTHPVGTKKPNELGIFDMSGNAYEWCSDWSSETYYASSPVDNPAGPATGYEKVIRGGCWYDGDIAGTRVAHRGSFDPQDTFMYMGFRCARDVPEAK